MAAGYVLHNCVRWRITGLKDRFTLTENYCSEIIVHLKYLICRIETINKITKYSL